MKFVHLEVLKIFHVPTQGLQVPVPGRIPVSDAILEYRVPGYSSFKIHFRVLEFSSIELEYSSMKLEYSSTYLASNVGLYLPFLTQLF